MDVFPWRKLVLNREARELKRNKKEAILFNLFFIKQVVAQSLKMESKKMITVCMHNKNKKYCSKCTGQKISFQDMGYASNAIMGLYFDPSITILISKIQMHIFPTCLHLLKRILI
jgi:hypothetical protein